MNNKFFVAATNIFFIITSSFVLRASTKTKMWMHKLIGFWYNFHLDENIPQFFVLLFFSSSLSNNYCSYSNCTETKIIETMHAFTFWSISYDIDFNSSHSIIMNVLFCSVHRCELNKRKLHYETWIKQSFRMHKIERKSFCLFVCFFLIL